MINPWKKKNSEKLNEEKDSQKDDFIKKGMLGKSHKWGRQGKSIARSISKSEMSGWLSKNIIIQPNEIAAIVQDGKVFDVMESGKMRVGGLLKTDGYFKDVDIVMMDTSPKDANWQVGELWTKDKHEITAKGLLSYRIADPKKFFIMVYAYSSLDEKGERFLDLEYINERIKTEVLTRVLQHEASIVGIEEIYGNRDFQLKLENELELQLKETLDMWGLELLTFTSEWDLGDYTRLMRIRREFERREEEEELGTLAAEGDIKREGRVEVAKARKEFGQISVKADLENQLKLKNIDTRLKIERLEGEKDFEDATLGIATYKLWKQAKIEAKKAEVEIDQEVADKEHIRDLERLLLIMRKGDADAKIEVKENKKLCMEEKKRFCMNCGASMPPAPDLCPRCSKKPPDDVDTKKCKNCGEVIPNVAKFCSACGAGQPG